MPNLQLQIVTSRTISATDGANVNSAPTILEYVPDKLVIGYACVTTGGPTTYECRAGIEGSFDGSTWFQLLRIGDITNAATGPRFIRLPGIAAGADAAAAALSLGASSAGGTITADAPWPRQIRGVTRLATLSGGSSPTVSPLIFIQGAAA